MIKSFQNQKKVITEKETPKGSTGKQYITIYTDTLQAAAKDLTYSAFKVYLWFIANKNGYEDVFSPKLISDAFGGDMGTIRDAFKVLVDKNYITLRPGSKATYIFHDKPVREIKTAEVRSFKLENGEAIKLTYAQLLNQYCDGDADAADAIWG